MNARRLLLVAMLAAIVAAITPRPAAAQPAAGQPSAALQAWVEAFNSRDPKRIVALYADDAVFWGTTAKTIATTPAMIADYFKDSGKRPATRVSIDAQHERSYGDIAIMSGAYTFADVDEGVVSNVRPARFSFVFHRAGERWLIVDHHSSRLPEP